ncbi:MAG: prephenate/arogenate dehydrogenase [Scytonema sp. PMC 1069.18]|nr:prephenate/arogenate dehydrogenase [Scytonema sp. PMC 1069.18]MEC4883980.1 prephenate/arogenate dehydrogenase [Scytonema sp. PMC 1070.18]
MNIGILGLGLIGGSLGFDLQLLGHHVLGVSRRESTCTRAIALGSVSEASVDMSLLRAAEVVFICTPLGLIIPTFEQLINHISPDTIITDVGSVKTPIVNEIAPVWDNFVGGHPMAGSTETGIEAAVRNLFLDKPYVLTPRETTPKTAIAVVEEIVGQIGATLYHCAPEEHDQAVSWISHLPVMVSTSLIAACMSETDSQILNLAQKFASSGFKDTSRVGGGNSELGVMMAQYNRQALLRSLQQYRHNLDKTIDLIEKEDWVALEQQLQFTKQVRPKFIS